MKIHKNLSLIKSRFLVKFLGAMRRINKGGPHQLRSERLQRAHVIRAAACTSMASAVGPRWAWTRAVVNNRRAQCRLMARANPRRDLSISGCRLADDLRMLVPGGEGMEFCRLLSESAHYIECLRAQVEVMNDLLDRCSASKNN